MSPTDSLTREQSRERRLARQIARADRLLEGARAVSLRFSRWRLAIFATGVAATVIPYKLGWYHAGNAAMALSVLIFFTVARYHSRLEAGMHRLRLWLRIKRANLARLRLDWSTVPKREIPTPEGHPYARDLDLTGPHSLLHLLDTTVSANGRERLAAWLLDQDPLAADPAAWQTRQSLVKELADVPLLRDRLVLEAALADPDQHGSEPRELDGHRIRTALEAPAGFPGLVPVLIAEGALAVLTAGLLLGAWLLDLRDYWILSLTAYASVYMLTSGSTASAFGRALALHHELEKLGAVFRCLERRSLTTTPVLARLCAPLLGAGKRPSDYLRRLARVCRALSVRAHPLVHLAVNALLPWDLFFTYRLERLRQRVRDRIPIWLDLLATLEAASALGTFAYLHPGYRWASLQRGEASPSENGRPAAVVARGLGHPLIPAAQRVTNDVELRGIGRILVLTGSNMSGKSTFLRTLGINLCLAQTGAPVCAEVLEWTWVRLLCCIRVDDSLEAGLSFFYAEVKRLKRLLDAAADRTAPPVLFLIDEIFKGTNNRERLIGSRAFIRALAGSHAFGLVTTHDLELAELEKEIAGAANAHFQETVEANELKFDYRLRPGPCPTTNALMIMALEGLPVPEPDT